MVVGCRVAQHGVSLSQPDVGIEHAAVIVLPGVAYVQQPLAVVDGLAVVGLVQVMEHEPLQCAGVVGVARQQFLLRADVGGVFLRRAMPRHAQEKQDEDDVFEPDFHGFMTIAEQR